MNIIKAPLTAILLCAVAFTTSAQPVIAPPTVKSGGLHGQVKMVMSSTIIEINTPDGGEPSLCLSETWLYDTDGRLTDQMSMSDDGMNEGISYRYNAQGRPASASYWGGDATREEKYIYAIDGRLQFIEVTYYQDDSKRFYIVTESDKQNRPTSIIDTLYVEATYRFSYDKAGRLKTSSNIFLDGPTTTYYGPNGIDSIISENEITTNQYNEQGNIVLGIWKNLSNPDEHRYTYTYDPDWYDKHGNWLWRKITLLDGTEYFENRQIIYYE